jgi:hypothetical protein
MNCWLTTHYRHTDTKHPYHIYLKDRFKRRADSIEVGDAIVFYELKGKAMGEEKIVAIAHVSGTLERNSNRDGGPDIANQVWEWQIACSEPDQSGRVAKQELFEVLGWGNRRTMRIPGGLMRLREDQFDKIATMFKNKR